MNKSYARRQVPTIAMGIFTLLLLIVSGRPSVHPDVIIYSYYRLTFLVFLLFTLIYLVFSLRKEVFLKINNVASANFLIVCLLLELIFRIRPGLLPTESLRYLPHSVRQSLAAQRGLHQETHMQGDGMLYSYKPFFDIPNSPTIKIDSRGFRNPPDIENVSSVDAVLLGDSYMIAEAADHDLGDVFRQTHVSALNLGFWGYSPYHYRDAYKTYVIDKKIKHRFVFIFLFVGNDFSDSLKYCEIKAAGGTYKKYLHYFEEDSSRVQPYVISLLRGVLDKIKSSNLNRPREIKLPYQTISVGDLWIPPLLHEDESLWTVTRVALDDIHALSKQSSSTAVVCLLPSMASVLSQFDDHWKSADDRYAGTMRIVKNYCNSRKMGFVDLNTPLREAVKEKFVFASPHDGHLSTYGIDTIAAVLLRTIHD